MLLVCLVLLAAIKIKVAFQEHHLGAAFVHIAIAGALLQAAVWIFYRYGWR